MSLLPEFALIPPQPKWRCPDLKSVNDDNRTWVHHGFYYLAGTTDILPWVAPLMFSGISTSRTTAVGLKMCAAGPAATLGDAAFFRLLPDLSLATCNSALSSLLAPSYPYSLSFCSHLGSPLAVLLELVVLLLPLLLNVSSSALFRSNPSSLLSQPQSVRLRFLSLNPFASALSAATLSASIRSASTRSFLPRQHLVQLFSGFQLCFLCS